MQNTQQSLVHSDDQILLGSNCEGSLSWKWRKWFAWTLILLFERNILVYCHLWVWTLPSGLFLPLSFMWIFKVGIEEYDFLGDFTTFTACFLLVWAWEIGVHFRSQTSIDQKRLWFLWQCNFLKNLEGFCFIHLDSVLKFPVIIVLHSLIAWRMPSLFLVIGTFCFLSSFLDQCPLRLINLIDLSKVPRF